MAKAQYNADSITVLEGLEAVRKRKSNESLNASFP